MNPPIPVIELTGTNFERGYVHGESLADNIAELFEFESENICKASSQSLAELLDTAEKHIPFCQNYAPALMDEMKGISEGAKLPFQHIFMLNAFLDLYNLWLSNSNSNSVEGCTTFGISGNLPENNPVFIGQNYDLHQHFERFNILLKVPIDKGKHAIVYSVAGVLGCAGLNGHGIGVVINKLFATDHGLGVIYPMIVREILSQSSLSYAVGAIVEADRASSMNYLVASKQEIINVETTSQYYDLIYATQGCLFHTNHYVSSTLKKFDAMPNLIKKQRAKANTYIRHARLERLMNCTGKAINLSLDDLFDIARDHGDHPLGICHHTNELWPEGSGKTVASIILSPQSGEVYLANGPPCVNEFVCFNV
jgi:isopenicillin-N N-acyltransferase-like protein